MPARLDILNEKFNKLTVVSRDYSRKGTYWLCKCDCGSDKLISATAGGLRYGNPKSCGCVQKEWTQKFNKTKIVDITGKRFGKLLALERTDAMCGTNYIWKCVCDCGEKRDIPQGRLTKGGATSCGCNIPIAVQKTGQKHGGKNYIDIGGQTFGYLKVLHRVDGLKKMPEYMCECLLCGNPYQAKGKLLKNGHVLSCGCLRSYGEQQITHYLQEKHLVYKAQYSFDDCRGNPTEHRPLGSKLRFDFVLFDSTKTLLCLIEFDGKGHSEPVNFNKCSEMSALKAFNRTKINDSIKNNYCVTNNIQLIRIDYKQLDKIQSVLDNCLKNWRS